jgi:hypothetical protein
MSTPAAEPELEALKRAWQELDRRLERLETPPLQAPAAAPRHRLRPPRGGQILQLCSGLALALAAGSFWPEHLAEPGLALCALLLHLYGIAFIACAARDLWLIGRIDPAQPVLAIQRQLAALQAWRVRAAAAFGAAGCLMWVPMVLLAFHAVGVDLWQLNPPVVWSFIASGLACLLLVWGLLRWSRRPGWEWLGAALRNSAMGRGLVRATTELEEIRRFETA